jgi:hypothetical protein
MSLSSGLDSLRSVENVRLIDRFNTRQQIIGTIYLTSTHLIFIDPEGKRETWILHSLLSSVDKLSITQQGCPLRVRTKNFFSAEFIIPKESDCADLHATLNQLKSGIKSSYHSHLDKVKWIFFLSLSRFV